MRNGTYSSFESQYVIERPFNCLGEPMSDNEWYRNIYNRLTNLLNSKKSLKQLSSDNNVEYNLEKLIVEATLALNELIELPRHTIENAICHLYQ